MSVTTLGCRCGTVRLELDGSPIVVAQCHCNSCREGARRLAHLPGAPVVTGAQDGVDYVLYRKDRLRITRGREMLRHFRLGSNRKTRRVIASCCNSPVLVEFDGGHWASLYGSLWPAGTLPALDLHTMTGDRVDTTPLDDGVPAGRWATTKFFATLLGAWIAMGFRQPALAAETPEIVLEG
ncbi:GFA family protein [Devosia beringensis]|uniref:GFA family protein n=1 Tax=Devosia beringensis TaxID=2657486 RepID=UPI001E3F0867|nr:hypothetical protein [Devosia beringensis]